MPPASAVSAAMSPNDTSSCDQSAAEAAVQVWPCWDQEASVADLFSGVDTIQGRSQANDNHFSKGPARERCHPPGTLLSTAFHLLKVPLRLVWQTCRDNPKQG